MKNRPDVDTPVTTPPASPAHSPASAVLLQQLQHELSQARAELACSQAALHQAHAHAQQAQHLAEHDSLTALPNRRCFMKRLNQGLVHGRARLPATPSPPAASLLAVLYLDLDGLKSINDRHGHEAGDGLLRIVATRLARAVRSGDLVCRMGGDEFACLLDGVLNHQQLSQLACKLFDAVSAPLQLGLLELTVRPSIGIALLDTCDDTTDALLRRADTAMYRAKRQQLGYAFFDPALDA